MHSSRETATVPDRPALRPVSLPDMTGAAESVQAQLRDRYASLTLKVDSPPRPPTIWPTRTARWASCFIAAEYLDAAESCFANAQALVPDDMRWPYYLGHVYRFRNEPAKAAAFFEQSLTLEPDHVPTLVWLGEMRLAQNRPDAAERFFTRALALQPRSAAALYGLGRAALARQQYAQAVTHLEAALALEPQASRIHYPLAMAYRGLGDRRNADAHLRQRGDVEIPSADPLLEELGGLLQNAAAYEVRGSEAIGKREWADAIRNLRKAIELAPQNPGTRLNLGTALYMTGDAARRSRTVRSGRPARTGISQGALQHRRDPGSGRARPGRHRTVLGRREIRPGYVEARMQLADALRRNGRLDESLSHYAEVIKTSPAISQARFGYAMALVRLRRYQEARDRLTDAVNAYPDQPGFAHALARVLAAAPDDRRPRRPPRAGADRSRCSNSRRRSALAETMAMALAELGEYDAGRDVAARGDDRRQAGATRHAGATEREPETVRTSQAVARCRHGSRAKSRRRIPWGEDDPVFHPRPAH